MAQINVTNRVKSIEYAIRDVIEHTDQLIKAGKQIYYLNIGDPVAFDFPTPLHIKQALCEAVNENNNFYSPSEGLPELREAIAAKEKKINGIDIVGSDVLVTEGVSEGIHMILAALIEKGDEVLFSAPTYPPYVAYTKFFDGKPVAYKTNEEEMWQPDIEDLKNKISRKTKALVITNPNNPTGALYEKKIIKEMLDLAAENDILVISDEIYDQITFSEKFSSVGSLANDIPIIGLNGFSKIHLMTGWRLGYIFFKDRKNRLNDLKLAVEKECRIRLCANTPAQKAGITALNGPQKHVKDMVEKLRIRRDYAWKRLNEIKGITCTKPQGAFYIFPKILDVGKRWKTDKEFVIKLLKETGVLIVNGSGFDPFYGAGHARAVFLPPLEILEKSFNKLERFMETE